MKTRRDLIQRTLRIMQVLSVNDPLDGDTFDMVDTLTADLLLELDEECALDFDPTDEGGIPEERMSLLVNVLRHSALAETFDKRTDQTDTLYSRAKYRLYAAIIGESDHVEDEPANF